jgi:hypothetical protein
MGGFLLVEFGPIPVPIPFPFPTTGRHRPPSSDEGLRAEAAGAVDASVPVADASRSSRLAPAAVSAPTRRRWGRFKLRTLVWMGLPSSLGVLTDTER